MPAYNFKRQFVAPIRSGRKRHTIRAKRKRATKPGEQLQLYCGMRTKHCEKIIPDPLCTKVEDIEMARVPVILPDGEVARFTLVSLAVGGQRLELDECEALAYADGFSSFDEMMQFWEGRLPFKGDIIHWREL